MRTLENIQEDHKAYVADGSRPSRQRLFHNVLHEMLLDIELERVWLCCVGSVFLLDWNQIILKTKICCFPLQVCIPGLHISLGVFKKIFDDLEDQCFELDKKIQLQLAVENGQLAEEECNEKILVLRTANQHKIRARELHENAEALQEMLTMQAMHSQETLMLNITALQIEVARMQKQAQEEVTFCRDLVKILLKQLQHTKIRKHIHLCYSFIFDSLLHCKK